jgi:transcriptional regulator GlxA family with amidase domain
MNNPISAGILLFNGVEVLDFAGPYEALSLAQSGDGEKAFLVKTVSQDGGIVAATGGLHVLPDLSFGNAPRFDILIVPGGYGARVNEFKNKVLHDWLRDQFQQVEIMASVCTGAFLLAQAGLLDGLAATTHRAHTDDFIRYYPCVEVRPGVKFVDQGKVITSGGVSAGINMCFHIVKRLIGREAAMTAAKRMEYDITL